ncbi:chlorophyllase/cutinase-like alpha/beta fold protein [Allobaculum mucilyticum]|uniref:poly(ethylene terephthalate) hydrolase family protein n=1 Tax=Allobaculum mucilyticum TaxID=2834459 RepID=UPI001E4630F8|nr:hypothetical protein [Allobaculum mucilyticum]UNT96045.1 hypothetical protein KWG62_12295 [Allobaculum mucilyticum]
MEEDRKYPILVLCNGTGVPLSKYESLARHYASWGFVVIGTEGEYAWNGFGAEMCVRHLERLEEMKTIEENNTQKENPFYHRLDLDRIGIIGHSQGAAGVFNAITAQPHHEIYKAAVALSLTNLQLAENLEWDYDPKKVETPVLLISGAGGGDDWVVTGDQLKEIYNEIPYGCSGNCAVMKKPQKHLQEIILNFFQKSYIKMVSLNRLGHLLCQRDIKSSLYIVTVSKLS